MKIKSFLSLALAIIMLSACNKNEIDPEGTPVSDEAVAYLSIKVAADATTRSSSDNTGANESDLKTIYLITFDGQDRVLSNPTTNQYYFKIDGADASVNPPAQKVSAKAEKLLVIANPGIQLEQKITSLYPGATYTTFNTAITGVQVSEVIDPDLSNITKGFAMINSGDEGSNPQAEDIITNPLIQIAAFIKNPEDYNNSDQDAKDAAENNRVTIKIERLASKVELTEKPGGAEANTGASFEFTGWTLDGLNTTFFPFAKKTLLSVHYTGSFYTMNFYTEDPNFENGTGVEFATINAQYVPELPHDGAGTWLASSNKAYCIENTMKASEQRFENATRMVIKGKYYPVDTWTGDWFSYAGIEYETLADLQAAYDTYGPGSHLAAACDKMYNHISDYYSNVLSTPIGASDFKSLTTGILNNVQNGGEVLKDGTNLVIQWYQGGLNYYYYEIRHDNENEAHMAFGKYGVVRNNWYSLTLNSVNGSGTPWYPDVKEPGPGDPDPTDPIDQETGYLGITISIAPWVFWERGLDL